MSPVATMELRQCVRFSASPRQDCCVCACSSTIKNVPWRIAYRNGFLGCSVEPLRGGREGGGGGNKARDEVRLLPVPRARIQWGVDRNLDSVIENEKKVKTAMRIRTLLMRQPEGVMSLQQLAEQRRYLGLARKKRCIDLLKKYPGVFELFHYGGPLLVRLTPEAEQHLRLEMKVRADLEASLVEKLRRLLMMSFDRRILVDKLSQLKPDLGLPDDFRDGLLHQHPEFFKCVKTDAGTALELVLWDPALAVSAMERKQQEQQQQGSKKLDFPQGYRVKGPDKRKLARFQDMPYFSPYADSTGLDPNSFEAEKHAVAVVHEFLSLTLEKRTRIDFLTHFRNEYKFSQRLYAMLLRHPELFYISRKGYRDSVFLRDAYRGADLIERDPLLVAKEFLADLASSKAIFKVTDERETEETDEDDSDSEGEWSDDEQDEHSPTKQLAAATPPSSPRTERRDVW